MDCTSTPNENLGSLIDETIKLVVVGNVASETSNRTRLDCGLLTIRVSESAFARLTFVHLISDSSGLLIIFSTNNFIKNLSQLFE